jgi:aldose 1-epimerase
VSKEFFGNMPDGTTIDLYTLKSSPIEARIMAYGAGIVSLRAPDRTGELRDIVLGFPDLKGYVENHSSSAPWFFGSVIGRYANRIARASFSLDGKGFTLARNNGENILHGGPGGFHNVVWDAELIRDGVAFHYFSKDGEEGFPGNLSVTVRYTLVQAELQIEYLATTDRPTVVNLTNHSYFNLSGAGRGGTILSHRLRLFGSRFTPIDSGLIPTGELWPVDGSPFDFRAPTAIGERIGADDEQLRFGNGYDHNFVLDDSSAELKQAAELHDPASGRTVEIWTTEPAIQFYSGNFLDGRSHGKNGVAYAKHAGLCLETQHYPDSPNHPEFPSTMLRPGQTFHSLTVYRFSAD